jgi:hypothetical protein
MNDVTPFRIDHDYDRENASDGVSRYATYVRQGSFEPYTDDFRAAELAEYAWRQATRPVMSPGYVRYHPRVLTARLDRSDWDGSLLATVGLVAGQPPGLRGLHAPHAKDAWWRSWPFERSFAGPQVYYEPGGEDLARGAYLLTTVSLRFTVPPAGHAEPPAQPGTPQLVRLCRDTVAVLVRTLNTIVSPVLARIDDGSIR